MKKKMISLLLVLALVVGVCPAAFAAEDTAILSTEKMLTLADALGGLEAQKAIIGLEDINFSALQLGTPVQTYVYTNETFEQGEMLYPIISDTGLVLWAIDLNGQFQITTALVNELNSLVDMGKSIAIIYDQNGAYLYMDETFTLLKTSGLYNPSRSVFDPSEPHDCNLLLTTTLRGAEDLPCNLHGAREQRYFSCNVKKVLQSSDNLCWAATVACISNYVKGTNYTCVSAAKKYYDKTFNYDQGITAFDVQPLMNKFNLDYTFYPQVPTDNEILTNIVNNCPIYSIWTYGNGYSHACCIYGTDIMNGYIYVMDPWDGFVSVPPASNGGAYTYKLLGNTLKLAAAACRSWD